MNAFLRNLLKPSQRPQILDGLLQERLQTSANSRNITIRMQESEIERVRRLAEKKGVGYQTYMKILLREALDREDRKTG